MDVTSRLTVDPARPRYLAISRRDEPEAIPREMSSRSARVSANGARRPAMGGMPPRGNNLLIYFSSTLDHQRVSFLTVNSKPPSFPV
jgi:hypothetical protein